ncbi:unnamed protein product, partial [Effrenium voratum]
MEGYVLRTLASLGATVAAARHTLRTGIWSGATSGGTHHAFADAGEGFCVFNDIAVAARLAQQEFGVTRVLVIDLDVHQGNGTAKIFAGDSRVYTVSVHQKKGYPFSTRFPSDLEVDLPDGCDDEQFLQALQPLEALVKRQAPQLIIYQAGVDGLAGDRFGRWNLTRPGLQARNDLVYSLAAAHGIPLILTMGGGYHKDILQTVEASADAYRQEFGVGEDGNGQTVYVYDASQEINDLGVLVMRCPLTGKNVNPFTTEVWRSIHAEFVRAASLLQAGHSLQELCEPAEALPSGCGHRGGGLGALAAEQPPPDCRFYRAEIAAALVWDEELPNEQKMRFLASRKRGRQRALHAWCVITVRCLWSSDPRVCLLKMQGKVLRPRLLCSGLAAAQGTLHGQAIGQKRKDAAGKPRSVAQLGTESGASHTRRIAFIDFWPGFEDDTDQWFCKEWFRKNLKDADVVSVSENPDVIMFSLFGRSFLSYLHSGSAAKLVFFTGENTRPPVGKVPLCISFDHVPGVPPTIHS